MSSKVEIESGLGNHISFHHVQMFVNELQPLSYYKDLEKLHSKLSKELKPASTIEQGKAIYEKLSGKKIDASKFSPAGNDIVKQLITGMGWGVTACNEGSETTSMLVTSKNILGAKYIVTAPTKAAKGSPAKKQKTESYNHFALSYHKHFLKEHNGRQGISCLAFETEAGYVDKIAAAYQSKHPALVPPGKTVYEYKEGKGSFKIFDVYAYYQKDSEKKADTGTLIRFVEKSNAPTNPLPGLSPVAAEFAVDCDSMVAFSDHWVSNVWNRKQFLKVLKDTLDFDPKVDFNAGVVAAGEAIIESTVAGNSPTSNLLTKEDVLLNQQQIYLPINNPLSTKGHVHLFVDEIGQGLQHIASRVVDLIAFIQRINNHREMTGEGFSFLNIPRSYYGRLTIKSLVAQGELKDTKQAQTVYDALEAAKLVTATGLVNMDITDAQIKAAIKGVKDVKKQEAAIVATVRRGRYNNLYSLLRDHLSEKSYLQVVNNKILVDIQANDVLFQIFTCNILQKKAGEEAPFLEFIQRVCSEKLDASGKPLKIRPGCGGFGIRNFLTLFLSIEVSKAMHGRDVAQEKGDKKEMARQQKMVDTFTDQLDESNPILTTISDAMTAESDALIVLAQAKTDKARKEAEKEVKKWNTMKEEGQNKLQEVSSHYVNLMKSI